MRRTWVFSVARQGEIMSLAEEKSFGGKGKDPFTEGRNKGSIGCSPSSKWSDNGIRGFSVIWFNKRYSEAY